MPKKYNLFLEQNLEKYLIRDIFEELLENIVNKNNKDNKKSLDDFINVSLMEYNRPSNRINKNINQKSKARVIYVSPQELPSGIGWKVLGQYDPLTHTIYMANNLSPNDERFVYYHEEAHSLGIMSESQADDYAASKTGYNLRNSYGMAA